MEKRQLGKHSGRQSCWPPIDGDGHLDLGVFAASYFQTFHKVQNGCFQSKWLTSFPISSMGPRNLKMSWVVVDVHPILSSSGKLIFLSFKLSSEARLSVKLLLDFVMRPVLIATASEFRVEEWKWCQGTKKNGFLKLDNFLFSFGNGSSRLFFSDWQVQPIDFMLINEKAVRGVGLIFPNFGRLEIHPKMTASDQDGPTSCSIPGVGPWHFLQASCFVLINETDVRGYFFLLT